MCQPGKPSPHGEFQRMMCPASAFFQRAKSRASRFSPRTASRVPSSWSSSLRPESLPYSGQLRTSKYTLPPAS